MESGIWPCSSIKDILHFDCGSWHWHALMWTIILTMTLWFWQHLLPAVLWNRWFNPTSSTGSFRSQCVSNCKVCKYHHKCPMCGGSHDSPACFRGRLWKEKQKSKVDVSGQYSGKGPHPNIPVSARVHILNGLIVPICFKVLSLVLGLHLKNQGQPL